MARIDSFLRLVAEQGVSDLHLHAGNSPIVRHDGELLELPFRKLTETEARRLLLEILSPRQRAEFDAAQELDFVYVLPDLGRFRANYLLQSHGLGAVFRVIPPRVPTLEDLGMPRALRKIAQLTNGLVLLSGPTGSGKSTTLAAMVHEINRSSPRHVISIEDPIEFLHDPMTGVVTQRQVGEHVESFAAGLHAALREAPDVLVVGEMRDLDSIMLALAAAETGVLVLGTLHSNSAAKAIDRIIDAVPDEAREQVRGTLSVLLRAVFSQTLVRRANGEGRAAVYELLLHNSAVANLVREGKTYQIDAYLETASADASGTCSLDHCLFRSVKEGLISLDEAMRVAQKPQTLAKLASELKDDQ